jgi:hypothetical protein
MRVSTVSNLPVECSPCFVSVSNTPVGLGAVPSVVRHKIRWESGKKMDSRQSVSLDQTYAASSLVDAGSNRTPQVQSSTKTRTTVPLVKHPRTR